MTQTNRHTANPIPTTVRRLQVTHTLRQLADFLDAHPDYPAPHRVIVEHLVTEADEIDERTRARSVIDWGKAHGGHVFEAGSSVYAHKILFRKEEDHGADVVYQRRAALDTQPTKRYLP